MLNRLKNLFKTASSDHSANCRVVPRSSHLLDDQLISPNARKVIDTLQKQNYSAYLVGGGVRDLLLDNRPKDFDIATNATPEQVKKLFRSALIIGRRFKIVHVRFGREIIEVTTFRGHHDTEAGSSSARSANGMLLRDNVFGDIETDALRRDFTVNALYYDPVSGELLDFAGGLEDLGHRTLRMIGDPTQRYTEDPVRMLRAVRFAAKLGFRLDPDSERPIEALGSLIAHVPPARLLEELLKLMLGGSATATFALLQEARLLPYLLPALHERLANGDDFAEALVAQTLLNTDKRIRQNKRVTPAFLFAAFLWPTLRQAIQDQVEQQGGQPAQVMQQVASGVIGQQLAATAIPKRFLIPMREIWSLQWRLPQRDGSKAHSLLQHPRFRAAYDFLVLREQAGEDLEGLGDWWTRFQAVDEAEQERMVAALGGVGKRRRKPRRRRRRSTKRDSLEKPDDST